MPHVADGAMMPSLDRGDRNGSVALVLLLAVVLVGAVAGTSFLDDEVRTQFILWFLAAWSAIGVLALFMYSIGVLQIGARAARNDLTKSIADSSQDGLLVTNQHGRIVYANAAYMTFANGSDPSLLKPVERLFTGPADVSEAVYRLSLAAKERRPASEEIRLTPPLTGEGAVGWYRVRVTPVERGGGDHASVWAITDLTRDRVRQENVFQDLQAAIDYLDHAPVGFFSTDAGGTIAYMNATLANWLNLDITQVGFGGLKLKEIVPGDSVALFSTISGRPGEVRTEVIDLDLKRRTGQALAVRLLHRVAIASDGALGPSRTVVLNRSQSNDIVDGQEAAEVRFARYFNNTPMAIATVDRRGQIDRSNGLFARLFPDVLTPKADGQTRLIQSTVSERDRMALEAAIGQAAAGQGDIAPIDVTLADGARFARFFVSAVQDGGMSNAPPVNTPASLIGTATPVGTEAAIVYVLETSEQKKLQEQFAQSQKMTAVGQLAGGVAHDFNNVLQAIIGFSDMLLANHRPTDPSFQDIMQIKNNANRAAGLVRQLLAFSRRQTMRPQVLVLGDVLTELTKMLQHLIGPTIELDVHHGRDLWPIKADINQFETVIVNLCVNAKDAMPNGGRVSIRTRSVDAANCEAYGYEGLIAADYVLVEVADTGTGIPKEVQEKIFEPFFTTKEIGKGTGLGLSTVYGIVKQTNGYIYCDSVMGEGTTFRIFLPRYVPTAEELAPKDLAEKSGQMVDLTGQGTILLVEDEEAVRAFGKRALASRGYTVREASSGIEAMRIVDELDGKIDLVVSDVVMPEMDGPTLLRELRKRNPDLKIIFVSGYAEDAFRQNLPEGEEFSFLPKPFSLKQLIETVKATMPVPETR
ncbi:MAG: response regulator [Beijerinckiaceae bacterium]|nr:response regulator [Beijerinckiaceae bacterium]